MQKQLIYKEYFFTSLLVFSYAYLHFTFCASPSIANSETLLLGQAPLPFAQRLLIPYLQSLVHRLIPIKIEELFFLFEVFFSALFYLALNKLMQTSFEIKKAQILTWLFFLLLPLITIINYRQTIGGASPIFYTYDTPTLFFIAAGYYCCLKKSWLTFYFWVFIATLNRESSILLVFLIPTLHWQDKKKIRKAFLFSSISFLIAKIIVLLLTLKLPGTLFSFYKMHSPYTLFLFNLKWLFEYEKVLLFIFCQASMSFLWFTFYDYIPLRFRPLRYLVLSYFIGLMCVGVFPEARIFTEIVLLLYLPVCIALRLWLMDAPPITVGNGIGYFINRYAVIGILIIILLFQKMANRFIIAFSS